MAAPRLFALACSTALLTLVALSLTPFDRYVQWQDLHTEAFARLGWIYERIHFDPTPIDVAFIGTSHTMNGIDGEAVADNMQPDREKAAAMRPGDGPAVHVANLAIPAYGRNLHWIIARELLEHRTVKTLVVEVFENETRRSHPAFYTVASWDDVVGAPLLFNLRYFSDLALLPLDHALLGLKTLLPATFGLHARFDPLAYDGPDPDNTRVVRVHGEAFTGLRDRHADPAVLDQDLRTTQAAKRYHMLPASLASWEYAAPLYYLHLITALAAAKHVQLVFLYLPGFGQDAGPHDPAPYAGHPMLTAGDLLAPHDVWYDAAHLNAEGAAAVSRRVGEMLAEARRPTTMGDVTQPAERRIQAAPP